MYLTENKLLRSIAKYNGIKLDISYYYNIRYIKKKFFYKKRFYEKKIF